VAGRRVERIGDIHDHVRGPELHPWIAAVREPGGPTSGDELLTTVDDRRPLVGAQ
jgi:hypothetical protein